MSKASYIKLLLTLIIFVSGPFKSLSQTTDYDSISAAGPATDHSVYIYAGYSDNLVIASSVSHKIPYYWTSLNYSFNNSLFLNTTSVHISGYSPFSAFSIFSAGYTHDFKSVVDVTMTLSGYKVPKSLENNLFSSLLYGDVNVEIDWKILYTEISASSLLKKGSEGYYEMKNSRYFQFPALFRNKIKISIQPFAELLFGSMMKIKLSEVTYKCVKFPAARWGEKSWETLLEESGENQGESSGGNPDAGSGNNGGGETGQTGSGSQGTGSGSGTNGPQYTPPPEKVTDNPGKDSEGAQSPDPGVNNTDPVTPGSGSYEGPDTGNGNPGQQFNPENGANTGTSGPVNQPGESGAENNPETGTGNNAETGNEKDPEPSSVHGTKGSAAEYPPVPVVSSRITDLFGLMEIDLGLPVSFNSGRCILELEPGYINPFYNDPNVPSPKGFTLMVNFYLKLF